VSSQYSSESCSSIKAQKKIEGSNSNLVLRRRVVPKFRYIVERKVGLSERLRGRARLLGLSLNIVPADQELSGLAGELKVVKKISLADCFAAALAKRENAEIYTRDPEFKTVSREIKIVWFVGASCGQQIGDTQPRLS
jgi:predicted nucleic acid-binding protein